MLIKDQIRARREQLGITIVDLAGKLRVTDQAVRHWESGRSNPSKRLAAQLEAHLDFRLDWTEGADQSGTAQTMNALLDQNDIDLLLVICRLPFDAKNLIGGFARMHLAAINRAGRPLNEREEARPIPSFIEKKNAKPKPDTKRAHSAPGARKAKP